MRGLSDSFFVQRLPGWRDTVKGTKRRAQQAKAGGRKWAARFAQTCRPASVAFILERQPVGLAKPVQHRLERRENRDGEADDRPK